MSHRLTLSSMPGKVCLVRLRLGTQGFMLSPSPSYAVMWTPNVGKPKMAQAARSRVKALLAKAPCSGFEAKKDDLGEA